MRLTLTLTPYRYISGHRWRDLPAMAGLDKSKREIFFRFQWPDFGSAFAVFFPYAGGGRPVYSLKTNNLDWSLLSHDRTFSLGIRLAFREG